MSNLKCKLSGHDWNDFARSWSKLDDGKARIKHKKCYRCGVWDYDVIIQQEQPSSTFDSFTTNRDVIVGKTTESNLRQGVKKNA